ncbi:hypothetical protein Tco_0210852 [Tanacetum coccineum]
MNMERARSLRDILNAPDKLFGAKSILPGDGNIGEPDVDDVNSFSWVIIPETYCIPDDNEDAINSTILATVEAECVMTRQLMTSNNIILLASFILYYREIGERWRKERVLDHKRKKVKKV